MIASILRRLGIRIDSPALLVIDEDTQRTANDHGVYLVPTVVAVSIPTPWTQVPPRGEQ